MNREADGYPLAGVARRVVHTVEEYLALDRDAEIKSEYRAGEIVAITHRDGYPGASRVHVAIVGNIMASLVLQLRGRPCQAFSSDLRVRAASSSRYTYPDITVVCGQQIVENTKPETLLNPTVLVEVLSDSTEAYDRGEKFAHYRRIPSLTDYVLVAQDRAYVEGIWLYRALEGRGATLALPNLDCTLALNDVYDKVEFPAAGTP